jgi:hypothetical protein
MLKNIQLLNYHTIIYAFKLSINIHHNYIYQNPINSLTPYHKSKANPHNSGHRLILQAKNLQFISTEFTSNQESKQQIIIKYIL